MTTKKPDQTQNEKFIEAAHMVEADHDQAAFEKRLKKIAKQAPKEPPRKS